MSKSKFLFLAILSMSFSLAANTCFAQLGGGGGGGGGGGVGGVPYFKLFVGSHGGKYEDVSKNDDQGTYAEQENVKTKGTQVQVTGFYASYEVEIESRSTTPLDTEHWDSSKTNILYVSKYFPEFKWIIPTVGYFQTDQKGDREVESSPPAFIEKNTGLILGLRTSLIPYCYNGVHCAIFRLRFSYLTTFEEKSNFGNEFQTGLGYVYDTGHGKVGLLVSYLSTFLNASTEDPDKDGSLIHVRSKSTSTVYGLYYEI